MERPVVDGRTAERTMCPEVSSMSMARSEVTKSTPLVRQRGLWDEDLTTDQSTKSRIRSETLEERHQQRREAPSVDPLDSDEVDDNRRSPAMFASSPHPNSTYYTAATPDSTYYTAATERVGNRRTSCGPKEQGSNTATKKSCLKHEGNKSREQSTKKTKERKILFATSESDGEVSSDVWLYEKQTKTRRR